MARVLRSADSGRGVAHDGAVRDWPLPVAYVVGLALVLAGALSATPPVYWAGIGLWGALVLHIVITQA